MTKLLERIRSLQDENNKLSRELSEAAGQTAFMFEKIIMVSQTTTFTNPPSRHCYYPWFIYGLSFYWCPVSLIHCSVMFVTLRLVLLYRPNKQTRNCKANWNNCGTTRRKFSRAWSQQGFRMSDKVWRGHRILHDFRHYFINHHDLPFFISDVLWILRRSWRHWRTRS